ncbi:hypothetical protein, partial [Alistipes putredinis]|uniref:hypothetical protein n=1 Tax=Alistipes putredinis TaxID=28117 RepID=UPI00242DE436
GLRFRAVLPAELKYHVGDSHKKTTPTPSRPRRTRFSVSYNYTSGRSLCGQGRQKNELIASQAPNSPQKQTLSLHKLN